jgi:hypothetical protein
MKGVARTIRAWALRHERLLTSAAFIIGFLIDAFTFAHVNLFVAVLLFSAHLAIVAGSLFVTHLIESAALRGPLAARSRSVLAVAAYFSLGALSSGFLAFFLLSGSARASWPFLALLFGFFAVNEWLSSYRSRLVFQASMFFIMLLSFSILLVPYLLARIGPLVFLFSAAAAAAAFALFLALLSLFGRARFRESRNGIIRASSAALAVIVAFYFLNVIPPVPLSLKDSGVYARVERAGDEYRAFGEYVPWYARFDPSTPVLHLAPGASAYAFSSVFAPAKLSTTIVHEWQRKEGTLWRTESVVPFPIFGGRDGGYRGYSIKETPAPGLWRVNVKTASGQTVGRIMFVIAASEAPAYTPYHL